MNAMHEWRRHRVVRICIVAPETGADHANAPVAELRDVAHSVEFRQGALRVDDYRADVLGLFKMEKAGNLAEIVPDVFLYPFDLAIAFGDTVPDTERIFRHCRYNHAH